ncbi:kinase-like protein [Lophiostoma macrostomum CBS 122681]|uniref:Kinase-like protein n=1 Tax=Lophiostoma macrostomum CBS 122681 TaxID=1314788 RepID=A0A6A6SXF3_9PLEO|nr:kinase-like protein [Lophiostoma macrostomum CBS 122681]
MRGGGGSPLEERVDEKEKEVEPPGLKEFPHWATDFDFEMIDKDGKRKKKPLGSGLWSDVYRALPTLPKPQSPSAVSPPSTTAALVDLGLPKGADASLTPPLTPVKSRTSSLSKVIQNTPAPTAYAIKVPASRSAKQVLYAEAEILSHLSRFPEAETYVVPFYGLDMRTGALVLKAMDCTLDSWISTSLNTLPEPARAARLAEIFPTLALTLIKGLEWMNSKGCIHADIKPSNVLFPTTSTSPVYTDFSSATLTHPTPSQESKPPTPLGGGTWDFLAPALVAKSSKESPATPTLETDVWSLAITLLYVIIGQSPFDCAGSNVYRRREMVKQGVPLSYTAYGDDGPRNLKRLDMLSKELGVDLKKWFAGALDASGEMQVDVKRWREELEGAKGRSGEVKM